LIGKGAIKKELYLIVEGCGKTRRANGGEVEILAQFSVRAEALETRDFFLAVC
jgi:hypothetical protein